MTDTWRNEIESGTNVHVDNDPEVIFQIVHKHGTKAWITPIFHTQQHQHHHVPRGLCWCKKDQIVEMDRLDLVRTD